MYTLVFQANLVCQNSNSDKIYQIAVCSRNSSNVIVIRYGRRTADSLTEITKPMGNSIQETLLKLIDSKVSKSYQIAKLEDPMKYLPNSVSYIYKPNKFTDSYSLRDFSSSKYPTNPPKPNASVPVKKEVSKEIKEKLSSKIIDFDF